MLNWLNMPTGPLRALACVWLIASSGFGEVPSFQKQVLTGKYYCDGITAGDINRDGKLDIVAGPFWYEGPAFTTAHEFYPAKEFPLPPSPTDSLFNYVHDFNGDDWPDILVLGRVHLHQAFWYENPKGASGHWKKHFVFERVKGESPPFLDVNGDGKPELVTHSENQWGLLQPDAADPTKVWRFTPITAKGKWEQFYHGTGIGDVNGDGRLDLILNDGWWEQPATEGVLGTEHRFRFGEKGGAQMFAYDVDGDRDNDIITSLDAHGWGLAWFEQIPEAGQITFRKHVLMGDRSEEAKYGVCFSQSHALAMADLNGDGLGDIVVGKRMWAHPPPKDIEPDAAPVLYWFQLVRTNGQATFVPHFIDDKSGVGVQVSVADVNGDARPDILTASKLGSFLFLNTETDKHMAHLETESLRVVIADNEAHGPTHRAGYNGVAELSLRTPDAKNLFVPQYAGLNLEHIFSGDAQSFSWNIFEPRRAPMQLVQQSHRVELHQERSEHWPLRSRLIYEVNGDAVDFTYCGAPLANAWKKHGYIGVFFASYIHQPEDMSLQFIGRSRSGRGDDRPRWINHLPPKHGVAANHRPASSTWDPPLDDGFNIPLVTGTSDFEYVYPFYFGRSGGNMFLMMFERPRGGGEVRFAQSPSGGGAGNPAWDFVYFQRGYEVNREFCFRTRVVFRKFTSVEDGVRLYEQWSGETVVRPDK